IREVASDELGWLVCSMIAAVLSGIAAVCTSALAAFRRVNRGNFWQLSRLENAAEGVNCPGMNDVSGTYDVVVIGGGPAERAGELAGLSRFDDEAETVNSDDGHVAIVTRDGKSLSARLVIGADGRQSLCRDAAGIEVKRRDLNQAALTFNIGHSRPHKNISTEFHTPEGPCVFVPLPGDRCSVVWVSSPKEAERLIALSDEE